MADPGFHSRADIPDHLREAVDRHISDMFPGEMHNDVSFLLCFLIFNYCVIVNCILNCVFCLQLRSKLKEMWKTFFTSLMIRTGHGFVDQMHDMVSLLSIELKKQPCTCKGNEPETENVVGGSSMSQKDDANADTEEEDVPVTALDRMLFAVVLQAPRTYIEG